MRIVPMNELQSKGDEPYLAQNDNLEQGLPYFSSVTYNREYGQIDGPPTIRLVHPVRDVDGTLYGAIVLNADFTALLQQAIFTPAPGMAITVLTAAGDHMSFGEVPGPQASFHEDAEFVPSIFASAIRGTGMTEMQKQDGRYFRTHALNAGDDAVPEGLALVVSAPHETVFNRTGVAMMQSAVTAAVLILIMSSGAAILAGRMSAPLINLATKLKRLEEDEELPEGWVSKAPELDALVHDLSSNINEIIRRNAGIKQAIHDAAIEGIITIDQLGIIRQINRAAEELFGHPPGTLVGARVESLMPGHFADGHQAYVARADTTTGRRQMARDVDITGRRRDGTTLPLEVSISPVNYDGDQLFVAFVRDITERTEADRKMKALITQLESSNAELDMFAHVASHDLKAPLRVIDNATHWLAEDLDADLTDATRTSMELIQARVRRMEGMLDDLLEHSRIGRTTHAEDEISGEELGDILFSLLEIPAGMTLNITAAVRSIRIQRMPLTTILLNLLSNAIKHHDRPDGTIELDVTPDADGLKFTVRDDGPGIDPRYHGRIFELFQTLKPRDMIDGSGLGLAIVKKHLSLAGGKITVESDGTRGTTFVVFWPLARPMAQHARPAA